MTSDPQHRTRTLWLCAVLHAFTHVYQIALLPLYYPLREAFHLDSLGKATLLVTVMMAAYFVPSYPAGILADRFSRKKLLTIGLLLNGLGFVALSQAPNYTAALVSVILAGIGGSLYHPAATAMVARIAPVGTGKALGYVGMGASAGFFLAPIYTGWRAELSGWRAPVLELGLAGMATALLFHWLAVDEPARKPSRHQALGRSLPIFSSKPLLLLFLFTCCLFSLRDFAGSGLGTLSSLFLQQAHGYDLQETGRVLSMIFIGSLVSNPLFGGLSDRGRFRWMALVLTCAAIMVALLPRVPSGWVAIGFLAYGFFFMASFPMTEAALMESAPDAVRGRVFGLFITIGGLVGNISHWVMGRWVEHLGPSATAPSAFFNVYLFLAVLIACCLFALPCLRALRKGEPLELPEAKTISPVQAAS